MGDRVEAANLGHEVSGASSIFVLFSLLFRVLVVIIEIGREGD